MFALAGAPVVEQWQAPRGCPDRDEMQARLAEVGGGDGLRVRGHIVELGGGLRLELSLGWGGFAVSSLVYLAAGGLLLARSGGIAAAIVVAIALALSVGGSYLFTRFFYIALP